MSGQDLFREFQNRVAQKRDSLRRDDCPEGYAFDEYQEGWRAAFSWATDILGDLVSEQGKDHFADTDKMEGNVDLEEEITKWIEAGDITDTRFDDYDDSDIERTARHFYEIGLNARKVAVQGIKLHGRILPGTRCNLYIESDCFDRGYRGLNYKFSESNDVDMFVQIRKK